MFSRSIHVVAGVRASFLPMAEDGPHCAYHLRKETWVLPPRGFCELHSCEPGCAINIFVFNPQQTKLFERGSPPHGNPEPLEGFRTPEVIGGLYAEGEPKAYVETVVPGLLSPRLVHFCHFLTGQREEAAYGV